MVQQISVLSLNIFKTSFELPVVQTIFANKILSVDTTVDITQSVPKNFPRKDCWSYDAVKLYGLFNIFIFKILQKLADESYPSVVTAGTKSSLIGTR